METEQSSQKQSELGLVWLDREAHHNPWLFSYFRTKENLMAEYSEAADPDRRDELKVEIENTNALIAQTQKEIGFDPRQDAEMASHYVDGVE